MSSDLSIRTIKGLGWRPDTPDHRDHALTIPKPEAMPILPPKADLRDMCPPVYDQGELGSCTAQAICAAIQFDLKVQKQPDFLPSRLFVYYNERVMEGTVTSDAGAEIRDGVKSIAELGDCLDSLWPYDVSKFAAKPSDTAYAQAQKHQALSYLRLYRNPNNPKWTEANLKYVLASLKKPFVFGFSVYDSFESEGVASTGVLHMPTSDERLLGGHAVMAVGYDDSIRRFIIRNSWGENWGMNGYYTMPYDYLTNEDLSDDFWVIKTMEESNE